MGLAHMVRVSVVLCALACAIAASPSRQTKSARDAQLAQADADFQRSAWQAAAEDYRAIVRDDPANGMAWFRLGMSLDQLDRGDAAVEAYGHASSLGFQTLRAELGISRILVRKGSTPAALDHLRSAAAIGFPPSVLDDDPVFAPLRSLADFGAIRTKAEEARFPCRSVHTFDYWVGDFDARPWNQPDGPSGGRLHNTREYDGCVIVERWVATGGTGAGMSMSFYDVNRHVWRMIWNDDANSSNDFEGSYHDGAMRFEGWALDAAGHRLLASNVLQDVTPDVIRHIYSTSADNGATWAVRSDGRFTRVKP